MDAETYIPHREQLPTRTCEQCDALLSTGNESTLCWAHGHTWSKGEAIFSAWLQAELGEALDRILAEA